jgi:3-isopropylmalate/(R)-2-methylmalate dehydratase large subunit
MCSDTTLIDKIWSQHSIRELDGDRTLLYVDRHFLHDGTSRQAFDGLRERKLDIANRDLTWAVVDHIVSTIPGRTTDSNPAGRERIAALRDNCAEFDVKFFDIDDPRQGIAHVIAPELGLTLPGTILVCGDSHTATNGGLGALAWGIGTTEVLHVLATQTISQLKPRQLRVSFTGRLQPGVTAKDLILYFIGQHGDAVGTGHAVEYAGPVIEALPVEQRMTICNMSIEFGAKMGIVGPDDATLSYIAGRTHAPKGANWDLAVRHWVTLKSDEMAHFDKEIEVVCDNISPQVTWGNSPQDVVSVDQPIPAPDQFEDPARREAMLRSYDYMDLSPGQTLEGLKVDNVFIGSCTNSRLSDLESAAKVIRGRKVHPGIKALVVPGSMQVKAAAESAGLDRIFLEAGFEWRNAGCSMCVTSSGDIVEPGKRSISTTNRNFQHRQGRDSRTHLASPATVAASAINGSIADIRKFV